MPLTNTDFDTTLKSCSQSQLRKLNKRFVCGKRSRKDLRIEPILNKQGHGKLRSQIDVNEYCRSETTVTTIPNRLETIQRI